MNPIVIHYVSGAAFFSGLLLIVLALVLSFVKWRFVRRYVARSLYLVGIVNIAVSATPLPVWIYILFAVIVIWQFACGDNRQFRRIYRVASALLLLAVCLLMLALELPFWFSPQSLVPETKRIYVIGDSLSAGIGFKGECTWSELLARDCGLTVINKSVGGGTVRSSIGSLKHIKDIASGDTAVIEIGGNDMFRNVPSAVFREDLTELLRDVRAKTHNIIMIELPLVPFYNAYGKTQRELAGQFNVLLIPKKYLAGVISGAGSTVDGLHLSNSGHAKMAFVIESFIKHRQLMPETPRAAN